MPRFSVLLLALAVGCASSEPEPEKPIQKEAFVLAGLPATFANTPGCDGCLALTLTLRPDGAYLVRERLGASEFYDFGRWRDERGTLVLEGGRDAPRRYVLRSQDVMDSAEGTHGGDLRRQAQVVPLRGPFRLTGMYDGSRLRECRTGVTWPLDESRAAGSLKQDYQRSAQGRAGRPALVAVDARFEDEGGREEIRVQRSPAILGAAACP